MIVQWTDEERTNRKRELTKNCTWKLIMWGGVFLNSRLIMQRIIENWNVRTWKRTGSWGGHGNLRKSEIKWKLRIKNPIRLLSLDRCSQHCLKKFLVLLQMKFTIASVSVICHHTKSAACVTKVTKAS